MEGERGAFEAVRTRLDEILEAVNAEDVTLDDALALYEEAVKLGLAACDLSEKDVEAAFPEAADAADSAAEGAPEAAPASDVALAPEPAAPDAASQDGRPASQD